jgi:hypothetical protein
MNTHGITKVAQPKADPEPLKQPAEGLVFKNPT